MASGTSKEMEIKLTKLLTKQIQMLEKEFLIEGGLRERMSKARIDVRNKLK